MFRKATRRGGIGSYHYRIEVRERRNTRGAQTEERGGGPFGKKDHLGGI